MKLQTKMKYYWGFAPEQHSNFSNCSSELSFSSISSFFFENRYFPHRIFRKRSLRLQTQLDCRLQFFGGWTSRSTANRWLRRCGRSSDTQQALPSSLVLSTEDLGRHGLRAVSYL